MKEQLLYWVTQENSIEIPLQNSLLYILLPMVHAHYCASYSKWPCVEHEVNMYCLYCMMSLYSRTFYFLLLSPIICLCDYTIRLWLMWQHDRSTLTLVALKIENRKINRKKIKNEKNKINQVYLLWSWQVPFLIYNSFLSILTSLLSSFIFI